MQYGGTAAIVGNKNETERDRRLRLRREERHSRANLGERKAELFAGPAPLSQQVPQFVAPDVPPIQPNPQPTIITASSAPVPASTNPRSGLSKNDFLARRQALKQQNFPPPPMHTPWANQRTDVPSDSAGPSVSQPKTASTHMHNVPHMSVPVEAPTMNTHAANYHQEPPHQHHPRPQLSPQFQQPAEVPQQYDVVPFHTAGDGRGRASSQPRGIPLQQQQSPTALREKQRKQQYAAELKQQMERDRQKRLQEKLADNQVSVTNGQQQQQQQANVYIIPPTQALLGGREPTNSHRRAASASPANHYSQQGVSPTGLSSQSTGGSILGNQLSEREQKQRKQQQLKAELDRQREEKAAILAKEKEAQQNQKSTPHEFSPPHTAQHVYQPPTSMPTHLPLGSVSEQGGGPTTTTTTTHHHHTAFVQSFEQPQHVAPQHLAPPQQHQPYNDAYRQHGGQQMAPPPHIVGQAVDGSTGPPPGLQPVGNPAGTDTFGATHATAVGHGYTGGAGGGGAPTHHHTSDLPWVGAPNPQDPPHQQLDNPGGLSPTGKRGQFRFKNEQEQRDIIEKKTKQEEYKAALEKQYREAQAKKEAQKKQREDEKRREYDEWKAEQLEQKEKETREREEKEQERERIRQQEAEKRQQQQQQQQRHEAQREHENEQQLSQQQPQEQSNQQQQPEPTIQNLPGGVNVDGGATTTGPNPALFAPPQHCHYPQTEIPASAVTQHINPPFPHANIPAALQEARDKVQEVVYGAHCIHMMPLPQDPTTVRQLPYNQAAPPPLVEFHYDSPLVGYSKDTPTTGVVGGGRAMWGMQQNNTPNTEFYGEEVSVELVSTSIWVLPLDELSMMKESSSRAHLFNSTNSSSKTELEGTSKLINVHTDNIIDVEQGVHQVENKGLNLLVSRDESTNQQITSGKIIPDSPAVPPVAPLQQQELLLASNDNDPNTPSFHHYLQEQYQQHLQQQEQLQLQHLKQEEQHQGLLEENLPQTSQHGTVLYQPHNRHQYVQLIQEQQPEHTPSPTAGGAQQFQSRSRDSPLLLQPQSVSKQGQQPNGPSRSPPSYPKLPSHAHTHEQQEDECKEDVVQPTCNRVSQQHIQHQQQDTLRDEEDGPHLNTNSNVTQMNTVNTPITSNTPTTTTNNEPQTENMCEEQHIQSNSHIVSPQTISSSMSNMGGWKQHQPPPLTTIQQEQHAEQQLNPQSNTIHLPTTQTTNSAIAGGGGGLPEDDIGAMEPSHQQQQPPMDHLSESANSLQSFNASISQHDDVQNGQHEQLHCLAETLMSQHEQHDTVGKSQAAHEGPLNTPHLLMDQHAQQPTQPPQRPTQHPTTLSPSPPPSAGRAQQTKRGSSKGGEHRISGGASSTSQQSPSTTKCMESSVRQLVHHKLRTGAVGVGCSSRTNSMPNLTSGACGGSISGGIGASVGKNTSTKIMLGRAHTSRPELLKPMAQHKSLVRSSLKSPPSSTAKKRPAARPHSAPLQPLADAPPVPIISPTKQDLAGTTRSSSRSTSSSILPFLPSPPRRSRIDPAMVTDSVGSLHPPPPPPGAAVVHTHHNHDVHPPLPECTSNRPHQQSQPPPVSSSVGAVPPATTTTVHPTATRIPPQGALHQQQEQHRGNTVKATTQQHQRASQPHVDASRPHVDAPQPHNQQQMSFPPTQGLPAQQHQQQRQQQEAVHTPTYTRIRMDRRSSKDYPAPPKPHFATHHNSSPLLSHHDTTTPTALPKQQLETPIYYASQQQLDTTNQLTGDSHEQMQAEYTQLVLQPENTQSSAPGGHSIWVPPHEHTVVEAVSPMVPSGDGRSGHASFVENRADRQSIASTGSGRQATQHLFM